MTLVEFLLARIAEDEAKFAVDADELAAALRPAPNPMWQGDDAYVVLLHVRLLAECDAKRGIVEWYREAEEWSYDSAATLYVVLQSLALPYAEHPDYDEGWRP